MTAHRSESASFSYSHADSLLREDERIRRPHGSAKDIRQPQRMPWRQSSDPFRAMVQGRTHQRFVEGEALRRSALRMVELGLLSGERPVTGQEPSPECTDHIPVLVDVHRECIRCGARLRRRVA